MFNENFLYFLNKKVGYFFANAKLHFSRKTFENGQLAKTAK